MMRFLKYVDEWVEPTKHSHPTEGRYGLDHPKAKEGLPEYTICIDPTCEVYEKARRQALIKAGIVVAIWMTAIVVMTLVFKEVGR